MDTEKLYKKIEDHVIALFENNNKPELIFHNSEHTQHVVKYTLEIAGHYKLSENEMLILYTAAWFHDTGHLFTDYKHHEEKGVELMKTFMQEHTTDEALIESISACIMATKFPRDPKNLLEEIICDADTYNFGTKEFKKTNKLVFEECKERKMVTDPEHFNESAINLLEQHRFYTTYAKDLLNKQKKKNLKKLKKKIIKPEDPVLNGDDDDDDDDQAEVGKFSGLEKDKSGLMSKGIQTMLRLTSENHLKLSEMADHKANILISVNSIIISVILGVLLRKLQEDTYLTIPTLIFLAVSVTTIVIAILSTRPKISGGAFTPEDIKQKKTNLLFFGNFYKVSYEQYNAAMREMMLDTDYLYGTLIKDIYYLGSVLGRKYKLIRLAYNIFMIGIIVSVLAFAIAAWIDTSNTAAATNGSGYPL